MSSYKIGDFVRLSTPPGVIAKVVHIKPSSLLVEQLDNLSKCKNKSVSPLVSSELYYPNKKIEAKCSQLKNKESVHCLSEFVKQFYDFESHRFDSERIGQEKAMLVRYSH